MFIKNWRKLNMLKKIFNVILIASSINQMLTCADAQTDKSIRPNLDERIRTCPRRTANLCTRMSEQCYDAYQKHPSLTPLTAAGLLIAGMTINPAVTCPFAFGLGVGTLYNKYKEHKE